MKKVLAVIGSPHKGETLKVVELLEKRLKESGEVEVEYLFLKDANLGLCKGCGVCLAKGEEFCPLKDDREAIYNSLVKSDGVIFAAPVYSLQVPAVMKNLLDRLAFVFHRPCFFGKPFIPVITQGVYGDKEVLKYLESVARFWGFTFCRGVGLTTLPNRSEGQQRVIDTRITEAAQRFYCALKNPVLPVPKVKDLILFRFIRCCHRNQVGLPRDYEYFKDKGWFDSPYFYNTNLSLIKKIIGRWADWQGDKQAEKIRKEQAHLV